MSTTPHTIFFYFPWANLGGPWKKPCSHAPVSGDDQTKTRALIKASGEVLKSLPTLRSVSRAPPLPSGSEIPFQTAISVLGAPFPVRQFNSWVGLEHMHPDGGFYTRFPYKLSCAISKLEKPKPEGALLYKGRIACGSSCMQRGTGVKTR